MYVCVCSMFGTAWVPKYRKKGVAEISNIGNLEESLLALNPCWHSEPTKRSKCGWSVGLPIYLSSYPSIFLSI